MARRRVSARSSGGAAPPASSYRARYAMPDGSRHSRTLTTKMDAEAWLAAERTLIDREEWIPPKARQVAQEQRRREAAHNTVAGFAERYLADRGLRPNTIRTYRQLLNTRILPYFEEMPLIDVSLTEIKQWRASLDPDDRSRQRRGLPAAESDAPGR